MRESLRSAHGCGVFIYCNRFDSYWRWFNGDAGMFLYGFVRIIRSIFCFNSKMLSATQMPTCDPFPNVSGERKQSPGWPEAPEPGSVVDRNSIPRAQAVYMASIAAPREGIILYRIEIKTQGRCHSRSWQTTGFSPASELQIVKTGI